MSIDTAELMGNIIIIDDSNRIIFRERVCAAVILINAPVYWWKYEITDVKHSLDGVTVEIEANKCTVVMQQKWDLINYYDFHLYMTYKPSKLPPNLRMIVKIVPFRLLSSRHERCPQHGHVFRLDNLASEIYLIGTYSFVRITKRQDGYFIGNLRSISDLIRTDKLVNKLAKTPIGFRDPSLQPIELV